MDASLHDDDFHECEDVPVQEQSVEDFREFFHECEQLTYIFTARGPRSDQWADSFGPDLVSALAMARGAYTGDDYDPPRACAAGEEYSPFAIRDRYEIVTGVRERLEELIRRNDTKFVLMWHIRGDRTVHKFHSSNLSAEAVRIDVCTILRDAVKEYILT